MKNDKKPTAGQVIAEYRKKNLFTGTEDVRDHGREAGKDLMKMVHDTAYQASQKDIYRNKDFYVVMMIREEKLLGVPNTYIMARRSCPSALYNQSVWKYHHRSQHLEFLWTIPDRWRYWDMYKHPQKYFNDKVWADILKFVLLMESGELLQWIIKENGEKPDGIIQYKENPNA